MSFFARIRLFQKLATLVFSLFMMTIIFVGVTCFMRKSSNTGMDMSMIQQVRFEASANKHSIVDAE